MPNTMEAAKQRARYKFTLRPSAIAGVSAAAGVGGAPRASRADGDAAAAAATAPASTQPEEQEQQPVRRVRLIVAHQRTGRWYASSPALPVDAGGGAAFPEISWTCHVAVAAAPEKVRDSAQQQRRGACATCF